jgi:hypothetical protein
VTDPDIVTPFTFVTMVSAEKTFWRTLLVTATLRLSGQSPASMMRGPEPARDMAVSMPTACTPATLPRNCLRPDQGQGTVLNLTNVSFQRTHTGRLSMRHRFGIFNATGNYVFQVGSKTTRTSASRPTVTIHVPTGVRGMSRHFVNGSLNAQLPGACS